MSSIYGRGNPKFFHLFWWLWGGGLGSMWATIVGEVIEVDGADELMSMILKFGAVGAAIGLVVTVLLHLKYCQYRKNDAYDWDAWATGQVIVFFLLLIISGLVLVTVM